ncbi:hypothetical protein ACFE04_008246 [Oxalis oulophora]
MDTHISPAKIILIGISLDLNESNELLSWAIRVLAHPSDTILAVHVIAGDEWKHRELTKKMQCQIIQAQGHVISVLGEFYTTCVSKQVTLEAKVLFSSSIARGLVDEASSVSANVLLLRGSRGRSNKALRKFTKFCFDRAPAACAVISMGKCVQEKPNSNFLGEVNQMSKRWVDKIGSFRASRSTNHSPRTVLGEVEEESQFTDDDSLSFANSTVTESPSSMAPKSQEQIKSPWTMAPYKLIHSLFPSTLRKKSPSFSDKEKLQPLLNCVPYSEIARATNNFHPDNIIGIGGYSEVYRGDLPDGTTIAVKRLAKDNKDAKKEKEFLDEIGVISHVNHPNTTTLIGCCFENGLYLILNFCQNGNLSTALHGTTSLDWPDRFKIALGVAKGLHYLHKCCKRRIIHRDIKASNVLLGTDNEPQITDFGLSKWLPNQWTHHNLIPIEGTFGYLAPEYFTHGYVDEKIDVFSFGVLLLEIVTGRRPVDSSQQDLLKWAKPLMESRAIDELADPKLDGKYDARQIFRVVLTASHCVRQTSAWRPPMSEVLKLLSSDNDTELAKSWRISKFTLDDLDDSSKTYDNDAPTDVAIPDDSI